MGVKGCHRRDCPNIGCDRHSSAYGYICNNCYNKLIKLRARTNIEAFMNASVNYDQDEEAAEAYFKTIFVDDED